MPHPYLEKIAKEHGLSDSEAESKWNQAKEAAHKQYPNLSEKDDEFWAITTSITKKMLHVKESLLINRTRLQEADLTGGTHDPDTNTVTFDDYPTWVAAMISCGASVESGTVFDTTASAYVDGSCVGEWNGDTGYADTAALNSLNVPEPTLDVEEPVEESEANDFTSILEREMKFAQTITEARKVANTRENNIAAQIAAGKEKLKTLREHCKLLRKQKKDTKAIEEQIETLQKHMRLIHKQKKHLAAITEGADADKAKLRKEYDDNEEVNAHGENALLLAKHFGTDSEVTQAKNHIADRDRNGYASRASTDFQYEMSQKYYKHLHEGALNEFDNSADNRKKGLPTKLVDEKTGEEVKVGDKRKDFRGEEHTIQGMTPPRHEASSGHVTTDKGHFYAGVVGAKYIHESVTEGFNGTHYEGSRDEMMNQAKTDFSSSEFADMPHEKRRDKIMQRLPLSMWNEFGKHADSLKPKK